MIDECCCFSFFFFFVMKTRSVVFTVEIVVIRCEFTVCKVISLSSDWIRVRDRSEKRTYRLIICSLLSECPTVGPDIVSEFSPWVGSRGAQGAKWIWID